MQGKKEVERKINSEIFKEQQKLLLDTPSFATKVHPIQHGIDPFQTVFEKRGRELIAEGKVACLLVAGGQGTRLGFDGPKGCYPLTPVKHKTLFQIFAEKLRAASLQANRPLKMGVMTSPENHFLVQAHFMAHDFFGCLPGQIEFFQQGELPFLSASGELVMEDDKILAGPDGNGSSIRAFFASPLAKKWEQEQIAFVNFLLVDNPIADPFDSYLVGAHACGAVDATIKCIRREDPEELLGLLVAIDGKPAVIEYTEAPKDIWAEKNAEGKLVYALSNISLFCFSFSFLAKVAGQTLPLHKALKKGVWKFERFIFDILKFAPKAQVLIYPRRVCFAPVKNKTGKNSPETARRALMERDREVLGEISGSEVPASCLEIDFPFYYPTPELLAKWKGKKIPSSSYVES